MKDIKFRYSCNHFFGEQVIKVDDSLSEIEIMDAAKKQVKDGHRKPILTELERCYNNKCNLKITIE